MASRAILLDYDEDLFPVPPWMSDELAGAGIELTVAQHRTEEGAAAVASDCDVVLIQSVRPVLTRRVIEQLDRCRCIVRLGIGYDSVDVDAATERGILVCNAPLYCVDDVAEHTVALLTGGVRRICLQDRWIREGKWDRTGARSVRRMRGSTLGLIGFGHVARAVAQRVAGFGMKLIAYDPYVEPGPMAELGVWKTDLEGLLVSADLISVHVPLTAQTHHLLSEREFSLVKPGAYVVNTSRGAVIDEEALARAIQAGNVAGAALDVLEREPPPANWPLRGLEHVVVTPHVGACSDESVSDLYRTGCEIAALVCQNKWPGSVVNPAARKLSSVSYEEA